MHKTLKFFLLCFERKLKGRVEDVLLMILMLSDLTLMLFFFVFAFGINPIPPVPQLKCLYLIFYMVSHQLFVPTAEIEFFVLFFFELFFIVLVVDVGCLGFTLAIF